MEKQEFGKITVNILTPDGGSKSYEADCLTAVAFQIRKNKLVPDLTHLPDDNYDLIADVVDVLAEYLDETQTKPEYELLGKILEKAIAQWREAKKAMDAERKANGVIV